MATRLKYVAVSVCCTVTYFNLKKVNNLPDIFFLESDPQQPHKLLQTYLNEQASRIAGISASLPHNNPLMKEFPYTYYKKLLKNHQRAL